MVRERSAEVRFTVPKEMAGALEWASVGMGLAPSEIGKMALEWWLRDNGWLYDDDEEGEEE